MTYIRWSISYTNNGHFEHRIPAKS